MIEGLEIAAIVGLAYSNFRLRRDLHRYSQGITRVNDRLDRLYIKLAARISKALNR